MSHHYSWLYSTRYSVCPQNNIWVQPLSPISPGLDFGNSIRSIPDIISLPNLIRAFLSQQHIFSNFFFRIPKSRLRMASKDHLPIWFITGCSSGFGLSLALLALGKGHKVIATSRNPSSTPEQVAQIEVGASILKIPTQNTSPRKLIHPIDRN